MNNYDLLKRLGYDTLLPSWYKTVELWGKWYEGCVPAVHRYRVTTGKGNSVRKTRLTMGMARQAAADLGGLMMSEKVQITVDDQKTDSFVQEVLSRAKFTADGAEHQERKAKSGTIAYLPYFRDAEITESGRVISGTVDIEYIEGDCIFPLTWEKQDVIECAFVTEKVIRGKKYKIFAIHKKGEDGTYHIEQHVFLDTGTGHELTAEERAAVPGLADLVEEVETGDSRPQFVIDRLNLANPDSSNPMGVSLYSGVLDTLRKMDIEYDSYNSEFELGRKRLFVAPELLGGNDQTFDPVDVVFYQLPEGYFDKTNEAIHESNPALRTAEHSQAIDDDLRYFSSRIGFGATHYRYTASGVTTATQVISENSDLFRTVQKHEAKLAQAIEDLVRVIIRLGNVIGMGLKEDAEITIRFDDSIVQDKEAERKQDMADVAAGIMSPAEYRAKWYGETLEQAQGNLPAGEDDDIIE